MDHAATTPLDPRVFSIMADVYRHGYFNPGSLYADGVATAKKVSESRKQVAALLGTTADHVVFTRGGTESDNLAMIGIVKKFLNHNPNTVPHIIVSEIEHPAILETAKDLEIKKQITLSIIPVDRDGIIIVDEIKKALRPETILVSIMYVNNEIGTIQPIREITKLVRWYKKQNNMKAYPLVHTDAIQATNYLDINVERLGVDVMSLSGSKMYGPKSSGVLYVRNTDMIAPIFHGGEQEMGLRAGTEDIAQIVGFAKAFAIARNIAEQESVRLSALQNYFFAELQKQIPGMKINGSVSERIPNNINISIPRISSERLVIELDAQGIAAASKSACREQNDDESYVIQALRKSRSTDGSIRFTMGRSTTRRDVTRTISALVKIVGRIKDFEESIRD